MFSVKQDLAMDEADLCEYMIFPSDLNITLLIND